MLAGDAQFRRVALRDPVKLPYWFTLIEGFRRDGAAFHGHRRLLAPSKSEGNPIAEHRLSAAKLDEN